jgi:hypothetical protein
MCRGFHERRDRVAHEDRAREGDVLRDVDRAAAGVTAAENGRTHADRDRAVRAIEARWPPTNSIHP